VEFALHWWGRSHTARKNKFDLSRVAEEEADFRIAIRRRLINKPIPEKARGGLP
jgi:hypothetical protein